MCGIAGIFAPESPPGRRELEAMNDELAHRGPDDSGVYLDGDVGLAHRRLSIIDLDDGQQPLFNEDGTVAVVFNGEIYNYRSLRRSLTAAGHRFQTDTDTEVLVHLYEEHGRSFVEQLEGMFAFALWDGERERLVLTRDPMGIKPLLVLESDDCLAFASELPALLRTDIDHGGLDATALSQYFAFGFIPAPMTAFKNVRKLRPGECMVVDASGSERTTFYDPSIDTKEPGIETAASELRSRVERSVEKRLMSDVPLGTFLSGGVDSSIIVGVMAELLDEPVKTFTVGFEEGLFDETWAANEVAEYHGTDHTTFTVTPSTVRDLVPDVLGRLGEPFADQSLLPTYVVAQKTSQDVTVALSGDGADELFAGYDRYRGEYLSKYYRAVPRRIRNHVIEPAIGRLPASRESTTGELVRKAKKFTRGGEQSTPNRHFEWMRIPDDDAVSAVENDPVRTARRALAAEHDDVRACLPPERREALSRIQAVDTRYTLPNQMLQKVDLASMYSSLEVRVPMLDVDVAEYAFSLPTSYKHTRRSRKRVLRKAFADLLPQPILDRGKQGFDMPVGEWFKTELAGEFEGAVRSLETDLLDTAAVLNIFKQHCTGRGEHGKFLWSVYVFAQWHEQMRRQGVLNP
ncbi:MULTISPECIES: asparagine synthase (glutamine-hydrolyzing) [Halorussus]|uniref:asparagine synthase (glutamine-hydrolyzing) n=1 Tax=Halorussus TaxID=1070314 RepID=UPI000E217DC0|nr:MULTISPECIES: asparagine synthase (glutamine-hydrolyzing) [Halorussus]NHN60107.1 asparagine synthase (glutamine-hydrolyzing) [Halorussus sp. JP-T4]